MTVSPCSSRYLVLFASILVSRDREMRSAIQFHDQPALRTIEIDNVRTYADLSAEFLTKKLTVFERVPKHGFRGNVRFAEYFAQLFLRWVVIDLAWHGERL